MAGYRDSLKVEEESRRILMPWFRKHCDEGRYVLTDKGRLSRQMQEMYGDLLMQKAGQAIWVELKAERSYTGNFFIEEWSNRPRGNRGWLYKLDCDLLFYHFLDEGLVYIINFPQLKRWLLEMPVQWRNYDPPNTNRNIIQYTEVMQNKYSQKNETWGRLVRILDVQETKSVDCKVLFMDKIDPSSPAGKHSGLPVPMKGS